MRWNRFVGALCACLVLLTIMLFGSRNPALAAGELIVYGDTLTSGWEDWSYGGVSIHYANPAPVSSGASSIAVTYTGGWSGLQVGFHGASLNVSPNDTFEFWIHGGSAGGQPILVTLTFDSGEVEASVVPASNAWTKIDIPLTGVISRNIEYIQWFNNSSDAKPVYYLDGVAFSQAGLPTLTPRPPGAGPALSVDASADQHAISPDIYGMNFADESVAEAVDLPVRRWGGNSTTRYNWELDVLNTGSDWYYENIPQDHSGSETLPNGSSVDLFVEQNERTGSQTILTIPLIGFTPKRRVEEHPYDCGFPTSRFPSQQSFDPWDAPCGNGLSPSGALLTGAVASDTSTVITPTFVTSWIQHLVARYGAAANGGVRYYNLDNEPMLWNSTHRDVHPLPSGYDELRDKTYTYGAALKSTDPGAKTLGPVVWGWEAYFYSALDVTVGYPWLGDYHNHGDVYFIPWYLQQMRAYEQAHGVRILDYLDLHYYPQANGVALSPAGDADTQALRLRSTRSLWDSAYADESWIADTGEGPHVRLIPRMKEWVATHYPGTKTAITEYNWGALDSLNGALAQADVLGIFGREGLDLATLWGPPEYGQPGMFAFRMYRNYDGSGSTFGDVSIRAQSDNQDEISIYAAIRSSDFALTIILINKTDGELISAINLSDYPAGSSAGVFRYSAADLSAIQPLAAIPITGSSIAMSFPAYSITLLVVPYAGGDFSHHVFLPSIANR